MVRRKMTSQASCVPSGACNFFFACLAFSRSIGQLLKIIPQQALVRFLHGESLLTEVCVSPYQSFWKVFPLCKALPIMWQPKLQRKWKFHSHSNSDRNRGKRKISISKKSWNSRRERELFFRNLINWEEKEKIFSKSWKSRRERDLCFWISSTEKRKRFFS